MDAIYRQKFLINDAYVDCFGRLKPSMALFFAQEVAGWHCLELGTDWDTLAQKNLFWAVIRHRVQFTRLPRSGETVTVETWPMPTTRVAYPRSVVVMDAEGKECFRAVSLWVLMDTENRSMVLPGKSGISVEGLLRGSELAPPNSLVPKAQAHSRSCYVNYSHLDRNGHMNNTRYMDWVDDLLPSQFHKDHPVKEFTVCYVNEARENQRIDLDFEMLENGVFQVDAHREKTDVPGKTERVFSAQVLFE